MLTPSLGLLAGFIGGLRALSAEQTQQEHLPRRLGSRRRRRRMGWKTAGDVGLGALLGVQPPGTLHKGALRVRARAGSLPRGTARSTPLCRPARL